MEQETIYYISEAAKKVRVESHVLRYWEEELQLPIKRNEMGHRCYTEEDVHRLQEIKALKEQGLQLKAIRTVLSGLPSEKKEQKSQEGTGEQEHDMQTGRDRIMEMVKERAEDKVRENEAMLMNRPHKYVVELSGDTGDVSVQAQEDTDIDKVKDQKAARLQYLLQHMITEAVRTANQELCDDVKNSILKEMDYRFRMQEEREEEHRRQEEEHYRRIDEMIRERHRPREKFIVNKKKP